MNDSNNISFRLLLLLIVTTSCCQARSIVSWDKVFIPQGMWALGGTVSYTGQREKNYRFIIIEDIEARGYSLNISPMFVYMLRDNMGIGGRLQYERSMMKIDTAGIAINSEIQLDVEDIYRIGHNFSCMGIWRNYMSIGGSVRWGLYNEARLRLTAGQSKMVDGRGGSISGVYETNFSIGVEFSPGIVAFVSDNIAVELNIGIFGINYTYTKQITNRVYEGYINSYATNFKFNLLSIGVGIAYYI